MARDMRRTLNREAMAGGHHSDQRKQRNADQAGCAGLSGFGTLD
jgi:hypothetical protein